MTNDMTNVTNLIPFKRSMKDYCSGIKGEFGKWSINYLLFNDYVLFILV